MIKKCDTWRKRCAKTLFLNQNWYVKKILFIFVPILIPLSLIVLLLCAIGKSIESAFRTFKYELLDYYKAIFAESDHSALTIWWIGLRYWSQRKAANYLFGLTDEENRGETWPKLTAEEEMRRGLSAEQHCLSTIENPEED